MIDIFAAFEVAEDAIGRQPIETTLSDLRALYGLYTSAKTAGKIDAGAILQNKATILVLQRSVNLFAALQNDAKSAPHLAAFLKSLSAPEPAIGGPSTAGVSA